MKSSISEPSKDVWFANSVNILLKTPSLLHYNAADDASVIDMWGTVRTGKERFDAFHLIFGKIMSPDPRLWHRVAHFALIQGFSTLHAMAPNKKRKPLQRVTVTALKNGAEGRPNCKIQYIEIKDKV